MSEPCVCGHVPEVHDGCGCRRCACGGYAPPVRVRPMAVTLLVLLIAAVAYLAALAWLHPQVRGAPAPVYRDRPLRDRIAGAWDCEWGVWRGAATFGADGSWHWRWHAAPHDWSGDWRLEGGRLVIRARLADEPSSDPAVWTVTGLDGSGAILSGTVTGGQAFVLRRR